MRKSCSLVAVLFLLPFSSLVADDYESGLEAFNTLDYETALVIWTPLADAGDADAQFGLGQMYGNGFGVMMDDAAALKWYGLAADQGHGEALSNLAVMHQNGWGVPMDEEEALRLYTLAAEAGVAQAMVAIGRYYAMDFAEHFDPVVAYKWFTLAARLGDFDGISQQESMAGRLDAEQMSQAEALISAWTEQNGAAVAANDL